MMHVITNRSVGGIGVKPWQKKQAKNTITARMTRLIDKGIAIKG